MSISDENLITRLEKISRAAPDYSIFYHGSTEYFGIPDLTDAEWDYYLRKLMREYEE